MFWLPSAPGTPVPLLTSESTYHMPARLLVLQMHRQMKQAPEDMNLDPNSPHALSSTGHAVRGGTLELAHGMCVRSSGGTQICDVSTRPLHGHPALE